MNRRAPRRRFDDSVWFAGSILGLSLLACDGRMNDGSCGSQATGTLQLAVWWQTETNSAGEFENAEAAALQGLIGSYATRCNPDVGVHPQEHQNKAQLIAKLDALSITPTRAELDALPDVVQLNAGDTALKYTACAGLGSKILAPLGYSAWVSEERDLPEAGIVSDVTALGNRLDEGAVWYERFENTGPGLGNPDPFTHHIHKDTARWLRPYLSCEVDGVAEPYVAPIAIHHVNRLYYNVEAALSLFGSDRVTTVIRGIKTLQSPSPGWLPPHSPKELREVLLKIPFSEWLNLLSANGGTKALVALPSDPASGWALNLLAAENIRVAQNLERGQPPMTMNSEVAANVMSAMAQLKAVSQLNSGQAWSVTEAMDAVKRGDAVFTVMGDWAHPDVVDAGVEMVPFPGTRHARVYTIDGFVAVNQKQVNGADGATKQAHAWLAVIDDETVAADFARTKGARSVKDWLDNEVLTCAKAAYEDKDDEGKSTRKDCWVVPAISMQGQGCDAAEELQRWASPHNDSYDGYFAARDRLAECAAHGVDE